MSLMTRLMGAAVIAVSGLTAAPVHAEGGNACHRVLPGAAPPERGGAVRHRHCRALDADFRVALRYDENWEPQPYLAESWEVSEDGMSVTLNLVQGATFHDGDRSPRRMWPSR